MRDIFDITTTDIFFYDKIINNKSQHYRYELKYMTSEEYFNECAKLHESTKEDELLFISKDNLSNLLEYVKTNKLPVPLLNYHTRQQEGRHRAILIKELGIDKMPVMCFYKN